MAKKKRKAGKQSVGQRGAEGPRLVRLASPLPNPAERTLLDIGRLLEGQQFDSIEQANEFLQKVIDVGVPRLEGDVSPLQKAQAKMYEAWEADGERRIALAREALEISPDCTDAYVLLADESVDTAEEALGLLELGIEVGKRALGPEYFQVNTGHFWELIETRPYMRALAGKAVCLMHMNERRGAIACARELLRLDPRDHQGMRHLLTKLLLLEGQDAEAGELLKRYEEPSAMWAYSYALWVFRTRGESEEAFEALVRAFNQNHFVPMYVAGVLELPEEVPDGYEIGSEEEAVICIGECFEPWINTPRAMEWLLGIVSGILDEFMKEVPRHRPKQRKSKRR